MATQLPAIAGGMEDIFGTGAADIWMVGRGTPNGVANARGLAAHWDGIQWFIATAQDPMFDSIRLKGVWGSASNDFWAVGARLSGTQSVEGVVTHYATGAAGWAAPVTVPNTVELRRVWGSGSNDVWAVGIDASQNGVVVRWTAGPASSPEVHVLTNAPNLHGLWGSAANDVWGGGQGVIAHWTNDPAAPDVMTFSNLLAAGLWGSASNDIWAVGPIGGSSNGFAMHWDGATWDTPITIAGAWFFGAWGSGQNDVWAVGLSTSSQTGMFARKIGSSWSSAMPATNATALGAIWGVAQ